VYDKEVELQKIQVLESGFQAWFGLVSQILAGGIIGMIILLATIYYQGILDLITLSLANSIVIAMVIVGLYYMNKMHRQHLAYMSSLIQKVENCEPLPSFSELAKDRR
jgi:hypothetical protein